MSDNNTKNIILKLATLSLINTKFDCYYLIIKLTNEIIKKQI